MQPGFKRSPGNGRRKWRSFKAWGIAFSNSFIIFLLFSSLSNFCQTSKAYTVTISLCNKMFMNSKISLQLICQSISYSDLVMYKKESTILFYEQMKRSHKRSFHQARQILGDMISLQVELLTFIVEKTSVKSCPNGSLTGMLSSETKKLETGSTIFLRDKANLLTQNARNI